jgi:hypothetical protein
MRTGGLIHNVFVGLLVLLAALAFTATAIAGWTHQTALVTDRFVSVITTATADPEVVDSLGTRVADQVVDRLGLEQRLTNLLPPALDRLAEPLTEAVHDRIATATQNLLGSPGFQQHWTNALTRLHAGFLNVVNGNSQYFTTTNGKLTLDLLAVMNAVVTELQQDGVLPTASDFPQFSDTADRSDYLSRLGSYLQAQLPPDFGQVPIADEASVQTIGNALHLFDQALVGMALLTIVLVLAAILFAHRTWNAVAWLGTTIVVMLGLILLGLFGIEGLSGDVVANPDSPVLVAALVGALAGSLATWLGVIAFAILIITIPAAFMARRVGRESAAKARMPAGA